MKFIADLHVHSPYSRATSPGMRLETLHQWAQLKGITVLASGDITHPKWSAQLREKLEPVETGLFRLRKKWIANRDPEVPESCRAEVRFMLVGEVSNIYKRHGRTRKVHNLVALPDFGSLDKFRKKLEKIGNIHSDGRPILGLDSHDLLEILLSCSPRGVLVPAHAWTPYFSVFGSFSGFNSLDEAYGDLAGEVFAIETGLSSDPPMNWRLSQLDSVTLISNGDAHSPENIGREANCFQTDLSYQAIWQAVKTRDPKKFLGTIEFFPEAGKYHYDGHRDCKISLHPRETKKLRGICPACGKKSVIGVLNQVEKMADRATGRRPAGQPGFISLVPLAKIISQLAECGVQSKKVKNRYFSLLDKFGPELEILSGIPVDRIRQTETELAGLIAGLRAGTVEREPGYDGEYGVITIRGKIGHPSTALRASGDTEDTEKKENKNRNKAGQS